MNNKRQLAPIAWGVSLSVSALAIIAWGQSLHWQFANLSTYRLFPVFGLLAFSLMWSTYAAGYIRRRYDYKTDGLKTYYTYVGFAILTAILLHPSLLIWQLWRDGFGLPPYSYTSYVGQAAHWAVIVSSLAWFTFLAYELRRWFGKKSWWPYVIIAGDIAIIGIFFHALRLGHNLQAGWYHWVWWFYGATLFIMLSDKYLAKRAKA